MAPRFWRIRLAILFSALRTTPMRLLGRVGLGVFVVVGTVALASVPYWMHMSATETAATDTVLLAVVALTALFLSVFHGHRQVDTRQFSTYPLTGSQIFRGLYLSTLGTWGGLWCVLWLVFTAVFRTLSGASLWSSLVAVIVALAAVTSCVRLGSVLGSLLISPRSESLVRAFAWVVGVAALPVALFIVAQSILPSSSSMTADAARVFAWTPFGSPAAAAAAIASGSTAIGLLQFSIALVFCIVSYFVGSMLTDRVVSTIPRAADPGYARVGLGWFERFPAQAWGVIAARSLTYWVRDPRYGVSLIAIPIAPILVFLALLVAGVDTRVLVLVPVPIMLLLLGWSVHNDVATDSTAVWQHVASGTRGSADRLGRLAPVFTVGVPLIIIGSSLSSIVLADWRILPAVVGMNVAVLCVSSGVASFTSALLPYPTTRPGESPFTQPAHTGAGSSAGFAQSVSMLAILLLLIVPLWVGISAIQNVSLHANLIALFVGFGLGVIVLVAGIRLGGRVFERSAPELLAISQSYD